MAIKKYESDRSGALGKLASIGKVVGGIATGNPMMAQSGFNEVVGGNKSGYGKILNATSMGMAQSEDKGPSNEASRVDSFAPPPQQPTGTDRVMQDAGYSMDALKRRMNGPAMPFKPAGIGSVKVAGF